MYEFKYSLTSKYVWMVLHISFLKLDMKSCLGEGKLSSSNQFNSIPKQLTVDEKLGKHKLMWDDQDMKYYHVTIENCP